MRPRPASHHRTGHGAHTPAAPRRRLASLVVPLAALAGFLCYANTLGHTFVWDDVPNVLLNTHIRDLRNVPALFSEPTYAGAADAMAGIGAAHYYRPLGMATLALDHAIWGERAFGYHLTNLLLHATACALLAYLLLARLGSRVAALVGALLFAAHPTHVEAVAWISGRNDLLLSVFALLAVLAWLRFRSDGRPRAAAGAFLACMCALFSKETAIVVPLLPALEELRAGTDRLLARLRGPAALALAAAAFVAIRFWLMPPPEEPVPLATRLFTAPSLVAEYLRLLFVPVGLRVFHWIVTVNSATSPLFLPPLAIVIAVVVGTAWLCRRDPDLGFGFAWILVTLLPLAGLAAWPKPTPFAERYLVLPSAGWAIVMATLVRRAERAGAFSRGGRIAVATAALVLAAVFASVTWAQSRAWRDNTVLLERITRDAPRWSAGHAALGRVYGSAGRWGEAIGEFGAATQLDPGDARVRSELADALLHAGQPDDAARVLFDLAWVKLAAGSTVEAERAARAGAALAPSPRATLLLASVLVAAGRREEARSELDAMLREHPDPSLQAAAARVLAGDSGR